MRSAVAFFIFNRPQCTRRTFERIRAARPPRLFVIADGPRPTHLRDSQACAASREIVDTGVNWPCEVIKDYSSINLGCRKRISSGLDMVFRRVEEAIILEDDCVPRATFFPFCDTLLEYYRDDERVMMISGHNERPRKDDSKVSYFFSTNIHIWGWATWRRAWRFYDVNMQIWPLVRDNGFLKEMLTKEQNPCFWQHALEKVYSKKIDTWDWQWALACWLQRGLSVIPNGNLVTNIGFDSDATHTGAAQRIAYDLPSYEMQFPLRHPSRWVGDAVLNYRPIGIPSTTTTRLRLLKSRLLFLLGRQ